MTIQLPPSIQGFFDHSNQRDWPAATHCFTRNAHVYDEKQNIDGHAAIEKWISHAIGSTDALHELISASATETDNPPVDLQAMTEGRISVSATVSGSFKGSPVILDYIFILQDGLISRLEIA
ncbi:nuclear transport factor 2 family protein [Thalassospira sp. TSL5-1]|uniref:nuclear transport factor 2 family protein n=1 Tax=Thalassospira sp. TSL5-1 TaxID=1544451 RepID=UPI00093F4921|nr:nuclear transport factor 2 family protein [Thalassospira sp. TSL5-1]OKH89397.1 hypothetical protein LF95_05240 [Thalassospira sp. TSL5-1]